MNFPNGYDPMGFSQSPPPPQNVANFPGNQQVPSQLYYANQLVQQQQAAQRTLQLQQAQAQLQQQQQQQYGGGNMAISGGVAMGGPLMRAGMQQQQMGVHQSPYSVAPYTQGIPSSTTPSTQQQHFGSASPHRDSPHTPQQHQQQQQQQTPQQIQQQIQQQQQQASPMSAPPATQAQQHQQSQQNRQNQAPSQSQQSGSSEQRPPLSPSDLEREKERVSLLLEINKELLQEVVNLQESGKATLPNAPQGQAAGQDKDEKDSRDGTDGQQVKPDRGYVECMRRLQANLAYLAAMADRHHKPGPIPTAPAIMIPPPAMPSLNEQYKKLHALFPGAKLLDIPPRSQQQGQQRLPPSSGAASQVGMPAAGGHSGGQGMVQQPHQQQ